MRKKYSLLGLIKEATEPDKKHSGKGKGLAVMVDGSKASDNSGALKAKTDGGGDVMLKAALKTLGSAYSGEYYVWTKAGDQPTIKPLGKYYKKGSGDPYTYDSLGETESGKRKYRVISGPINGGTYKSGRLKGKKIGTRPIGAIFTMGKELDPVPAPEPTGDQSECKKIAQLYSEQSSKLKDFMRKEESITGAGAGPNANQSGSRAFIEDLLKAFKTIVTAEERANEEETYNVGTTGDAIDNMQNMKKNVEAVEDGSGLSGPAASVQRYNVFNMADETLINDLTDIFNVIFLTLEDIGIEYARSDNACNDQIKQLGVSLRSLGGSGDGPMNESLSRGSLYRRKYWGRY